MLDAIKHITDDNFSFRKTANRCVVRVTQSNWVKNCDFRVFPFCQVVQKHTLFDVAQWSVFWLPTRCIYRPIKLKFRAVGINGDLLALMKNLFSNRPRMFQTRVNDLLSVVYNLLTGVIQRSVIGPLGPLMFLIYISDLVVLLAS